MKRRSLIIIGITLEILLMSAAFVGGRMMAEQDQQNPAQVMRGQLPSQLPKESPAGSGTVQNIQESTITLSQGMGPGGGGGNGGPPGQGGPGGQSNSSSQTATEVVVTSDTKYYAGTSSGGAGMPGAAGGGQTSVQVQEAGLTDVKVGNMLIVWGTKNGTRITAEVIYIQSLSFGP